MFFFNKKKVFDMKNFIFMLIIITVNKKFRAVYFETNKYMSGFHYLFIEYTVVPRNTSLIRSAL